MGSGVCYFVRDTDGNTIYSCGAAKGREVDRFLKNRLPVNSFEAYSWGISLKVTIGELGFDSAQAFRTACAYLGKEDSEEIKEARARAKDGRMHVVRDENGCLLGCFRHAEAARRWPDHRCTKQHFVVARTVSFDEVYGFLKNSKKPMFDENLYEYWHRLCHAIDFHPLVKSTDDAQDYWASQSGVMWRVYGNDWYPICMVPYDVVQYAFGDLWFMVGEFSAQLARGIHRRDKQRMIKDALRYAATYYDCKTVAGSRCPRMFEQSKHELDNVEYARWARQSWEDGTKERVVLAYDKSDSLCGLTRLGMAETPFSVKVRGGEVVSIRYDFIYSSADRQVSLHKSMVHEAADERIRQILLDELRNIGLPAYVLTADGKPYGYYPESMVWDVLTVRDVLEDGNLIIPDNVNEYERMLSLRGSLRRCPNLGSAQRRYIEREIDDIREGFQADRDRASTEFTFEISKQQIKPFVGACREALEAENYSLQTIAETMDFVERQSTAGRWNRIVGRIKRGAKVDEKAGQGARTSVDARNLINRALAMDPAAIKEFSVLLAAAMPGTPAKAEKASSGIPEWALPQREFVLRWADRTYAAMPSLRDQTAALYVANRVREHKADILVFDGELYDEVASAQIDGRPQFDSSSFPYPVCIIKLSDVRDVYGCAVCKVGDVNRFAAKSNLNRLDGAGLHLFLIGDEPGEAAANGPAEEIAERLVSYIDCDNANIETVYIDGGESEDRQDRPLQNQPPIAEIRDGVDYTTGVQVVIERDYNGPNGLEQSRRAHFRRGHYARRRVGTRDNWHYEKRWIKPTFVHGSGQTVTRHKVVRIVL